MVATGKVYKIVNDINEKVYIGETSRNLEDRFSEHCFDKRSTTQIHKAITKWCVSENLPSRKKDINSYSDEEWEFI